MSLFYIPAGAGEAEFTEKRSRFLGHVRHAESEEEARLFIAQVKKEHYDARHNCWCYILRDGAERYSDDGEPQGTAGIPMLEVFRREGISDVVCVVTRYFGGVLLGSGGLLRAYTRSAKDALDAAGVSALRPWTEADIRCSYAMAQRLQTEVSRLGGLVSELEYGTEVVIKILSPKESFDELKAHIFDISGGSVSASPTGESYRAVRIR